MDERRVEQATIRAFQNAIHRFVRADHGAFPLARINSKETEALYTLYKRLHVAIREGVSSSLYPLLYEIEEEEGRFSRKNFAPLLNQAFEHFFFPYASLHHDRFSPLLLPSLQMFLRLAYAGKYHKEWDEWFLTPVGCIIDPKVQVNVIVYAGHVRQEHYDMLYELGTDVPEDVRNEDTEVVIRTIRNFYQPDNICSILAGLRVEWGKRSDVHHAHDAVQLAKANARFLQEQKMEQDKLAQAMHAASIAKAERYLEYVNHALRRMATAPPLISREKRDRQNWEEHRQIRKAHELHDAARKEMEDRTRQAELDRMQKARELLQARDLEARERRRQAEDLERTLRAAKVKAHRAKEPSDLDRAREKADQAKANLAARHRAGLGPEDKMEKKVHGEINKALGEALAKLAALKLKSETVSVRKVDVDAEVLRRQAEVKASEEKEKKKLPRVAEGQAFEAAEKKRKKAEQKQMLKDALAKIITQGLVRNLVIKRNKTQAEQDRDTAIAKKWIEDNWNTDVYNLLGVSPTISHEDLKNLRRTLQRDQTPGNPALHPDLGGNSALYSFFNSRVMALTDPKLYDVGTKKKPRRITGREFYDYVLGGADQTFVDGPHVHDFLRNTFHIDGLRNSHKGGEGEGGED